MVHRPFQEDREAMPGRPPACSPTAGKQQSRDRNQGVLPRVHAATTGVLPPIKMRATGSNTSSSQEAPSPARGRARTRRAAQGAGSQTRGLTLLLLPVSPDSDPLLPCVNSTVKPLFSAQTRMSFSENKGFQTRSGTWVAPRPNMAHKCVLWDPNIPLFLNLSWFSQH